MNARGNGFSKLARSLLIVISISNFMAGCSSQPAPSAAVVRPVKTTVVVAGEQSRSRSFPGKVEASKAVELAFQVPGLLINIPVKKGQNVAEGELIAQLRQDEFKARLTALQGQLDQGRAALSALRAGERPEERLRRESQVRAAAARLNNARTEFNRFAQLAQLNASAVARVDYDRAETNYHLNDGP